jgi:hypothetical protein
MSFMDKLWVVLLSGLPWWGFLVWAIWWLTREKLRERRRNRRAARPICGYTADREGR